MSIYAKVSQVAVAGFKNAVGSARETDGTFSGALDCLRHLSQHIQNKASELQGMIQPLDDARSTIQKKIGQIEARAAQLTVEINNLQAELDAVTAKIAVTPPSLSRKDSEGNTYLVDNPSYTNLCANADALRNKIAKVESELSAEENHLHRAQAVLSKIDSHNATICEEVDVLEQRSQECIKLIVEVEDIRVRNVRQTEYACELLERIEQIIGEYLSVILNCVGIDVHDAQSFVHSSGSAVDATGNSTYSNNLASLHEQQGEPVFFTEYSARIEHTPQINSSNGFWTGLRGESIFVPSIATEKGKAGIAKLKEYGLLGIKYTNGEPNYYSCSEGTVIIGNMTADRGTNFAQADIMLAEQWNVAQRDGKNDWTDEDVENFRKTNKLSWHECCDTKTMHLVSRDIHGCETSVFLHSGGVAECKRRDDYRGEFDD